MFGRLSKQWSTVLVDMYDSPRCKQLTSHLLILRMIDFCFSMWDQRNRILHDKQNIHHLHGEKELNSRVMFQHALGTNNIIPNDEHLIKNVDLEILLNKPIKQRTEWLKLIEAARSCKMPDGMKDLNYSRNIMSNFLGTRTYRSRYKKKM